MSLFRRILVLAVVCLASFSAAQLSDQRAAQLILGPHWQQIARASGTIFSGTVIQIDAQPAGKGSPLPLVLTTFRIDRAIAGVHKTESLTIREWAGAWSVQRPMTRGQRLLIFLYPPSRLGLTSPVDGRLGQVLLNPRGEVATPERLQFAPDSGGHGFRRADSPGLSGAFAPQAAPYFSVNAGVPAQLRPCRLESRSFTSPLPQEGSRAPSPCVTQDPNFRAETAAPQQRITLAQLERAIRAARRKSIRKSNDKE